MPRHEASRLDDQRRECSRGARFGIGVAITFLVVVLVIVFGVFGGDHGTVPPSTQTATTPVPVEDVRFRESASLTVPQTVRTAAGSFETVKGQAYLLEFEVSTTKPEGSPGAAMYLGVSLNCIGEGDAATDAAGGTQNLITGERTTLRNQFILSGDGEQQSCNISVSAPHPEVAAAGTTIDFDARWAAKPVEEESFEVDSTERLPRAVPVDGREVVFSRLIGIEEARGREINVLSTLHLTACTGVNGSFEDGREWCDAATVDPEGSEVGLDLRIDLLDDSGRVCGEVVEYSDSFLIDRFTHHRLVDTSQVAKVPSSSCGSSLRVSATIATRGPAPVVVHGSASSLVVVFGKQPP